MFKSIKMCGWSHMCQKIVCPPTTIIALRHIAYLTRMLSPTLVRKDFKGKSLNPRALIFPFCLIRNQCFSVTVGFYIRTWAYESDIQFEKTLNIICWFWKLSVALYLNLLVLVGNYIGNWEPPLSVSRCGRGSGESDGVVRSGRWDCHSRAFTAESRAPFGSSDNNPTAGVSTKISPSAGWCHFHELRYQLITWTSKSP